MLGRVNTLIHATRLHFFDSVGNLPTEVDTFWGYAPQLAGALFLLSFRTLQAGEAIEAAPPGRGEGRMVVLSSGRPGKLRSKVDYNLLLLSAPRSLGFGTQRILPYLKKRAGGLHSKPQHDGMGPCQSSQKTSRLIWVNKLILLVLQYLRPLLKPPLLGQSSSSHITSRYTCVTYQRKPSNIFDTVEIRHAGCRCY